MFKKIRGAWNERREQQKENAFDRGFSWASTEILRGRLSTEEVEMHLDSAIDWGPFDSGAYEALNIIKRMLDTSTLKDPLRKAAPVHKRRATDR